jgi:hypothetical protein
MRRFVWGSVAGAWFGLGRGAWVGAACGPVFGFVILACLVWAGKALDGELAYQAAVSLVLYVLPCAFCGALAGAVGGGLGGGAGALKERQDWGAWIGGGAGAAVPWIAIGAILLSRRHWHEADVAAILAGTAVLSLPGGLGGFRGGWRGVLTAEDWA